MFRHKAGPASDHQSVTESFIEIALILVGLGMFAAIFILWPWFALAWFALGGLLCAAKYLSYVTSGGWSD